MHRLRFRRFVIGSVALSGITASNSWGRSRPSRAAFPSLPSSHRPRLLILGMGLPHERLHPRRGPRRPRPGTRSDICPGGPPFRVYYAIISNITPPGGLAATPRHPSQDPSQTGRGLPPAGWGSRLHRSFAFCYDPGLSSKSTFMGNIISIVSGVAAMAGLGFASPALQSGGGPCMRGLALLHSAPGPSRQAFPSHSGAHPRSSGLFSAAPHQGGYPRSTLGKFL